MKEDLLQKALETLIEEGVGAAGPGTPGATAKAALPAVTAKRLYAFDASYRYSPRRHKRKTGRPVELDPSPTDRVG